MDRQELTAKVAYALWEHRGRGGGGALEDWVVAERLVGFCLEALAARKTRNAAPRRRVAPAATEKRALEVLTRFVERRGRAAASAALGYASTSVVSGLLSGRRALGEDLAARIEATLGEGARLTVLAGRTAKTA